jgi:Cu-Zn family superoxide dismutase
MGSRGLRQDKGLFMLRATALALLLTACATSEQDPPPTANTSAGGPPVESALVNTSGAEIGKVQFGAAPTGVLIRIIVEAGGLSPGWHGTHLHSVGDCSDTAKFEHAAGHIQKSNTNHGLLYVHGPENGDLPNLSAAGDGSASAEMFSSLVTLSELQDADGSALIIHANPDDHATQPLGNSGDRVACASLRK